MKLYFTTQHLNQKNEKKMKKMKKGENVFILVGKWKWNVYKSYLSTQHDISHTLQNNFLTKKKKIFIPAF